MMKLKFLKPITLTIQSDDENYFIEVPELFLYAFGNCLEDALLGINEEIECLHFDLSQDDKFSEQWLIIKREIFGL